MRRSFTLDSFGSITPILLLLVVGAGCNWISGKTDMQEVIFPTTEIGEPVGERISKDIGPAGGSLVSPDGRLTVTVPQGALKETVPFSIQPITNKADGGLGLAYRLEPDGTTFATPLELTIRYDEQDLKGTVAEALSVAYQDKQGAWHAQRQVRLDQASRTLTIATTHFTDYTFISRVRINPVEQTIKAGYSVIIAVIICDEPGFWDKLLSRPVTCKEVTKGNYTWDLQGPGELESVNERETSVKYLAPDKKPSPNVANLFVDVLFKMWNDKTGEITDVKKTLASQITIIDRGYRATGGTAHVKYSGLICDLTAPFTIIGTYPSFTARFNFVPSSQSAGTASYAETPGVQVSTGAGTYTIEHSASDSPKIVWAVSMNTVVPRVGSHSASGSAPIQLIPLETGECN